MAWDFIPAFHTAQIPGSTIILNSPDFRYNTYWWGKWNLSGNDATTPDYAEQYGFTTGGLPCPSPNGNPGQGLGVDPLINLVFQKWLSDLNDQSGPWCTTVSLVNPHDIAWYPRYTNGRLDNPPQPGEDNPPSIFHDLPANFERPESLVAQNKPGLQDAFRKLLDELIGVMPANPVTPGEKELWYQLLDLYVQVTHYVDQQIGAVLQALAKSGADKNTIIIFTSDHGEYGGAHGLRDKGFANYEESIHVPLYVYDPTENIIPSQERGTVRNQLTSHVDIVPLLMTLASGSNAWRTQPQYAQLAGRAYLADMLSNPNATGRDYIIHTSDEDIPEQTFKAGKGHGDVKDILNSSGNPPSHVIGYRTKTAKLGVYSYFAPGTIDIQKDGQQAELYNYQQDGIDEVTNRAPGAPAPDPALYAAMYDALFNPTSGAVATELRQPLPNSLKAVQERAINTYLAYEAELQGIPSPRQVYVPFVQK